MTLREGDVSALHTMTIMTLIVSEHSYFRTLCPLLGDFQTKICFLESVLSDQ